MSELLSDAEFLGTPAPAAAPSRLSTGKITPAPTKPAEPAPSKPAARVVSDEEFLSGKKDTFKQPTTFDLALQSGVEAAKNLGGSAAVLADMVLSLPGFVMGVGAQAGGTIAAAARGVPLSAPEPQRDPFDKRPQVLNPVTAYGVGREAGHMVSEPFMNPLQKLFTMLKSPDAYSGSSGGKAMEKFGSLVEDAGKWVEERTNGQVSRDSVPMLVDTVMASAVGLGAKKPGIDPQAVARMRAQLKDLAADAQSRALERDMAEPAAQSPVARAGQRQVQQQINELLGIVPDEVRAQQAKERRKQVQQAFRSPDQSWQYPGREYNSILESIAKADERMGAEAAWRMEQNRLLLEENARGALDVEARAAEQAKQPERIGQAEILRIMQKPGHERTAEDLITLREARRQGGNVRPEVPLLLSAAGLGAIAGAELSDDDLRGALLGGATGTAMALPFMWRGASVPSSFRQAGAVKGPGGMWHPEAVERLSSPLKDSLVDGARVAADHAEAAQIAEARLGRPVIGRPLPRGTPELTEAELIERNKQVGPASQRGSIDPQLAIGLGSIGLGALAGYALSEDSPGTAALLGALAGGSLMIPGVRKGFTEMAKQADYLGGVVSTRIGNVSPALRQAARSFEMRNLTESHALLDRAVPWMKEMERLPKRVKEELSRAILTNDRQQIADLMKGNAPLIAGWREVRNILNEVGEKLQSSGRFRAMKDDYFPRLVKDFEGLKEALDQPVRTRLETLLQEAEAQSMKLRGRPLTNIEQAAIINREISAAYRTGAKEPGFTKARTIKEVTEQLQPFYYTPAESLYAYIRGSVQDIEMARFFGRNLVETEKHGQKFINTEQSVGNLVGEELRAGKIKPEQAQELINILRSRFEGGERSSNALVQTVRNLGNMGLLGSVVSAMTQMADTAMATYAQGLRANLTAIARQLSGKEKVTAQDFGLADHMAEEFLSTSRTADWLNKTFKYSGFSAVDRFGKTTMLNAALDKATRLAQTEKGQAQLAGKYQEAFGREYPELVADLKAGRLTERVRAMLFSELSDFQPISKMEVPQGYLDNPNGRLMYMLKTFMIKQFDVVRRDVYNEMKQGHVGSGVKNALAYATVLGLSGAATDVVKNWLMGRPVSFDKTDIMENVLKTFGWGAYVREKISQGKPVEAMVGSFAPPYKMMDDLIRMDPKAVQYIPLLGKLFYNWELGGREEAELREAKKAKKEGKDYSLSPRAEEYKELKRERQKERRERKKEAE